MAKESAKNVKTCKKQCLTDLLTLDNDMTHSEDTYMPLLLVHVGT